MEVSVGGGGVGAPSPPPQPGPLFGQRPTPVKKRTRRTMPADRCQVVGCSEALNLPYHRKYHICSSHFKSACAIVDGHEQRFCQKCGRFQPVAEFDGDRKTCRAALEMHNARRRKQHPNGSKRSSVGGNSGSAAAAAALAAARRQQQQQQHERPQVQQLGGGACNGGVSISGDAPCSYSPGPTPLLPPEIAAAAAAAAAAAVSSAAEAAAAAAGPGPAQLQWAEQQAAPGLVPPSLSLDPQPTQGDSATLNLSPCLLPAQQLAQQAAATAGVASPAAAFSGMPLHALTLPQIPPIDPSPPATSSAMQQQAAAGKDAQQRLQAWKPNVPCPGPTSRAERRLQAGVPLRTPVEGSGAMPELPLPPAVVNALEELASLQGLQGLLSSMPGDPASHEVGQLAALLSGLLEQQLQQWTATSLQLQYQQQQQAAAAAGQPAQPQCGAQAQPQQELLAQLLAAGRPSVSNGAAPPASMPLGLPALGALADLVLMLPGGLGALAPTLPDGAAQKPLDFEQLQAALSLLQQLQQAVPLRDPTKAAASNGSAGC